MRLLKNIFFVFTLTLTSCAAVWAQFSGGNITDEVYEKIPQEGVYVHQNSDLLFAGERLYFSVYCLNLKTHTLSNISKIAYVALVNSNKDLVFRQKIRLHAGRGQGDFYIPADMLTGSYKLIAYTQWMQSRTSRQFYESDLLIINPYRSTTATYLEKVRTDSVDIDSSSILLDQVKMPIETKTNYGDHLISLNTDRNSYDLRSPVQIEIQALRSNLAGDFSLTIKRIDSLLPAFSQTTVNFWRENRSGIKINKQTRVIPELRGELINGIVTTKEGLQAVANRSVVLSLPGDPYTLDVARTDVAGRFYFNLDAPVDSRLGILQILGEDRQDFTIQLEKHKSPDIGDLEFRTFTLNKSRGPIILERSIHNQIENAYGIVKSDTIVKPMESLPFYRDYQQVYYLDDFTRFNTIRETMVEIVDNAWIDENGEEDPTFGVRPFDGYLDAGALLPLVTMDGLFIQAHKDIVDFNSKELRRISLSRDRYVIGPEVYQGLLALETKAGDFQELFYRDFLLNTPIPRPEPVRSYYFQHYGQPEELGRIPDLRYQLYWDPHLRLDGKLSNLQIYTSDIKGTFEVELIGFTQAGEGISIRKQFTVE